nr:MAG TPA: hypothetical protein [Caudoviricetes sp.]
MQDSLSGSLPPVDDFIGLEVIVAGTSAGIISVPAVGMIVSAVRARVI